MRFDQARHRLLQGPYQTPRIQSGQKICCVLRGNVRVCGWKHGRIPWPIGRAGHGGKGAYVITPELARAIRHESALAISYWWGVHIGTVGKWRQMLGVQQFNEGTLKLYSLWKEPKLPDETIAFDPTALRKARLALGLTQLQVARKMGWNHVNSYGQMETGRRQRAHPQTLRRLARVFRCEASALTY